MDETAATLDLSRTGVRIKEGTVEQIDARGKVLERHLVADVISAEVKPLVSPKPILFCIFICLSLAVLSVLVIPSPRWSCAILAGFLLCGAVAFRLGIVHYLILEFSTGRIRVRVRDAWCDAAIIAGSLAGIAAGKRPHVPHECKTNAELADWNNTDLTVELAMRVLERIERDGADSLNEAERFMLALHQLIAEVNSGGFYGWVSIVDPLVLYATPQALKTIELERAAELVSEALSPFGDEGLSDDPEEQTRKIDAASEHGEDLWMRLEEQFVGMDDEIIQHSFEYAKTHMEEIREFP